MPTRSCGKKNLSPSQNSWWQSCRDWRASSSQSRAKASASQSGAALPMMSISPARRRARETNSGVLWRMFVIIMCSRIVKISSTCARSLLPTPRTHARGWKEGEREWLLVSMFCLVTSWFFFSFSGWVTLVPVLKLNYLCQEGRYETLLYKPRYQTGPLSEKEGMKI